MEHIIEAKSNKIKQTVTEYFILISYLTKDNGQTTFLMEKVARYITLLHFIKAISAMESKKVKENIFSINMSIIKETLITI